MQYQLENLVGREKPENHIPITLINLLVLKERPKKEPLIKYRGCLEYPRVKKDQNTRKCMMESTIQPQRWRLQGNPTYSNDLP